MTTSSPGNPLSGVLISFLVVGSASTWWSYSVAYPMFVFSGDVFATHLLDPSASLFGVIGNKCIGSSRPSSPGPAASVSSKRSVPLSLVIFVECGMVLFPPTVVTINVCHLVTFYVSGVRLSTPSSVLVSRVFTSFMLVPYSSGTDEGPHILSSLIMLFGLSLGGGVFL